MSLRVVPCTLKQANAAIALWHRHHKPVRGYRFGLRAVTHDGRLVGVCTVGRPVARGCDPYAIFEVTRLVTDGTKNACSLLYAAAARASQAMGAEKIQTYILDSEPGTSLKAAGWTLEGYTAGGDWNCKANGGGRRTDQPQTPKARWSRQLNPTLPVIR